jgi:hypothetical protein
MESISCVVLLCLPAGSAGSVLSIPPAQLSLPLAFLAKLPPKEGQICHPYTHTHTIPSCKAPDPQPPSSRHPGMHSGGGGKPGRRWQGQQEGAAERKTEGTKQTRSRADISQPVNFLQFCFPASETSWFLPVHPLPHDCIVQLVSRDTLCGGGRESTGSERRLGCSFD